MKLDRRNIIEDCTFSKVKAAEINHLLVMLENYLIDTIHVGCYAQELCASLLAIALSLVMFRREINYDV